MVIVSGNCFQVIPFGKFQYKVVQVCFLLLSLDLILFTCVITARNNFEMGNFEKIITNWRIS